MVKLLVAINSCSQNTTILIHYYCQQNRSRALYDLLRVVARGMDWNTAKANCEAGGNQTAVFENYHSLRWLQNILKYTATPAGIRQHLS